MKTYNPANKEVEIKNEKTVYEEKPDNDLYFDGFIEDTKTKRLYDPIWDMYLDEFEDYYY